MPTADEKQEIREKVWGRLRAERVARFPGAQGRIPNFVIPVNFILTPKEMIACEVRHPRPKGIYWDLLTEEKVETIPALKARKR